MDLLAKIPLFSALTRSEREELSELLEPRKFPPRQTIVWLGEQGEDFFIIESGEVDIIAPDETGKEVTLGALGPGQFFGEISLLDGGRRTATVRSSGDLSVLCLHRSHFLQFLRKHPDAAIHMLTILGKRQRETVELLRGIRNANEAIEAKRTTLQRFTEKVASVFASEGFLVINLVGIVLWMMVQTIRYEAARAINPSMAPISFIDQPPTFFWLGFIVTVEAIVVSIFVLNSQRQQARRDRIRADLDYQVNVKAHQEVMGLHQKVDRMQVLLARHLGVEAINPDEAAKNGAAEAPTNERAATTTVDPAPAQATSRNGG